MQGFNEGQKEEKLFHSGWSYILVPDNYWYDV